jgi:peptidoglycan hydrolase CwlO-like protein
VLTVVSALFVVPGASAAHAESAGSARAKAHRSEVKVHRLQARLDKALAAYDTALNGLTQQVASGIDASDALDASTQALQAAQDQRTQQVRALYMDGGQIGVYASVLTAASPQDLALRMMTVSNVVAGTDAGVLVAQQATDSAQQQSASANQQVDAAVLSADDVTARAATVDALVREGKAELAHLSARARKLTRAQLAADARSAAGAASSAAGNASAMPIPPAYLSLYQHAAKTCSGMQWTLLAAVGQVESGHGRNDGPSSAGAVGPMQFRPRTFDAYAVDGNHDGHLDPWNPADAIFTAAHFLCVNGGGGSASGIQRALLHYNNAQWYVDLVLGVQQRIATAYQAG